MRVVLASVGTRGDVQPMLAFARALVGRGHEAVVACPATFAGWARAHGVEHQELGEDMQALIATGKGAPERSASGMTRYFTEQLSRQAPALLAIARGADAIVATGMAWTAPSVAEKLGVPALLMLPSTAALPSRSYPPPLMPWFGLPRWANGVLWWMSDAIQNRMMGGPLNAARATLGLPPVAAFDRYLLVDTPVLVAADEALLPPDPRWAERCPYTGFLFLDDPAPLDPALDAWLSSGEPPVCVTFGSMAGDGPARVSAILRDAIAATRCRCLVLSGSGGLFAGVDPLPDAFHVVREAPHQRLFPRVAALVHHGGSGTTAAALRAGVPQVILPMMLDQFLHAQRVAALGLGPSAPTMAKVTADTLCRAIDAALALPKEPLRATAERVHGTDAARAFVDRLEHMTAAR